MTDNTPLSEEDEAALAKSKVRLFRRLAMDRIAMVEVNATSPRARELLERALKWIRRIEERKDDLPALFMDNCDPMPLRKDIERHLTDEEKRRPKIKDVDATFNHLFGGTTP